MARKLVNWKATNWENNLVFTVLWNGMASLMILTVKIMVGSVMGYNCWKYHAGFQMPWGSHTVHGFPSSRISSC